MNPPIYSAPFTSANSRARIVKILLVIGAVVTGLSLVAEALSLTFPPITDDQDLSDNPVGAAVVLVIFLLAVLWLMIYVATAIVFLMWIYRAYDNLRALNPTRPLNYSPGWAVGGFFIPFVNLVIPYRAVKEVWQKSGSPDEGLFSEPSPPAFFPIWWTFWLLSSFAGNASTRASFNENIPEQTATIISIVASALSVIAAVFAYLVVDAIDQRQEESSANLRLGRFSGPPPPPTNLAMPDVVVSASGPTHSPQS